MSRIKYEVVKKILALSLAVTLGLTLSVPLTPTLVGGRRYKYPWNLDIIDVEEVSPEPYDGSGVYIALLDTGLHEDYKQYLGRAHRQINTELARNFVDAPSGGDTNYWTTDGHGTVMASIIIGYRYHGNVQGVAPGATVIPIRVLPASTDWHEIANALNYVHWLRTDPDSPIQGEPIIVSMSLGGPKPGDTSGYWYKPGPEGETTHQWFLDYIKPLIGAGVVVVAAAGNSPAAQPPYYLMDYPAAWPEVISVGAVEWDYPTDPFDDVPEGDTGEYWEYSRVARLELLQQLDVAAPGANVFAPPVSKGDPASYDGTSASAAHVSGLVALMLQKDLELVNKGHQDLDQTLVEKILNETAHNLRDFVVISSTITLDLDGRGLVNASKAIDWVNATTFGP